MDKREKIRKHNRLLSGEAMDKKEKEELTREVLIGLGNKILKLRKERKLTLNKMAEEISMSPGLISQVERGVIAPSLETLLRISKFFGVSPAYLLDDITPTENSVNACPVIHPNKRKVILTHGGIKFSLLSNKLELGCEFMLIEYPPNSSTGDVKYTHKGIECGFVLEGELDVEVENEVYHLTPGTSITYKSSSPHRTVNRTSKKVLAIWVNSDPFIFSAK